MNTDKTNGTDGMCAVPTLRERITRAGGLDIGEPRPELFFTATSRRVSLKCLDWKQKPNLGLAVAHGEPMILTAVYVCSDRGPVSLICDVGKN